MMKKLIAVLLLACMLFSFAACGGKTADEPKETDPVTEATVPEEKEVLETDHIKIEGLYLDNGYTDKDNDSMKLLYVFYTVSTNDTNLKVCSKNSKITIEDTNTYSSEKYEVASKWIKNYYYSDYIEDVYMGNELKMLATFKMPVAELAAGRNITFSLYGVEDSANLKLTTDLIQTFDSAEAIAEKADPTGYAEIQDMYLPADDETESKVKKALNGYYWSFYVNSTSYRLEFFSPNKFEIRVPALNHKAGGTYEVKKGFICITYTGKDEPAVDIPYNWGDDGDIELHCTDAFDVH